MLLFQPGLLHIMWLDEQWKKVIHDLWVKCQEKVTRGHFFIQNATCLRQNDRWSSKLVSMFISTVCIWCVHTLNLKGHLGSREVKMCFNTGSNFKTCSDFNQVCGIWCGLMSNEKKVIMTSGSKVRKRSLKVIFLLKMLLVWGEMTDDHQN
jgi:hypothetical protein